MRKQFTTGLRRAVGEHGDGHDGDDHEHAHGDDHIHPAPSYFLTKYVFSTDHKVIGIQFLFSALIFFLLGGLLAMAVRWQLAWPWKPMPILEPAALVRPVAGLPDAAGVLQHAVHDARHDHDLLRDHPAPGRGLRQLPDPADDRRRDMAFPEAEHDVVLVHVAGVRPDHLLSFFVEGGAAEAGWTSYPAPDRSARWATPAARSTGQTFWLMALLFVGISSMMGSVNYITTIINAACPGHDAVPHADDGLGHVHHGDPAGLRPAGA